MRSFSVIIALAFCLLSVDVSAEQVPAKGMFLVATEEVEGPYFAKTVILLLHHDRTGSFGLVVNRPIDVSAMESLELREDLVAYSDSFYWGGPVSQSSMHALLRTDTPPERAEQIVDSIYLVEIDELLLARNADTSTLRFFAGYAGWGAGQLQYELAFNSWLVVPASEALVFADDDSDIWYQLTSKQQYRAAITLVIDQLQKTGPGIRSANVRGGS